MRWRKSNDQKIMDRARQARRERISGERDRERYGLSSQSGVSQEEPTGGKRMIKVTRLSGEVLYLNIFQIESMESIPETKIKMMNGYYFLVKDSADSVIEQIRAFLKGFNAPEGQGYNKRISKVGGKDNGYINAYRLDNGRGIDRLGYRF